MNLGKKLTLIVFTSVALVAIPTGIGVYFSAKHQLLSNKKAELSAEVKKQASLTFQTLATYEYHLNALAHTLSKELKAPPQPHEVINFDALVEKNTDGAWRNQREVYNGNLESGIFIPPHVKLTADKKSLHLRTKQVIDAFSGAIPSNAGNIWLLTHDKSEVIFDHFYPNFVFDMAANTDYSNTPWIQLGDPAVNANREVKWTAPLYEPVTQSWMVSAILPLDVNQRWLGNLGRDLSLTNVVRELFQYSQHYQNEQHFLLDSQGAYLYAGAWQAILEKTPSSFKPDLTQEPTLNHLLQQKLTVQPQAFDQIISIKGVAYIAIGVRLLPTNWQYFRLIPVAEILTPIHQMFFWLATLVAAIALTVGLLINLAVKQHIIKRLQALTMAVRQYGQGNLSARYNVSGDDEITQTSLEFNTMADQLQATLEAIPDLLFEMDLHGKYYTAHAPKLDLLAAPIAQLLGKSVTEILPKIAAETVLSALQEAYQNGYSHGKQFSIPLAQGDTWFELSVAKKANSSLGNPRFILLARDISDRKLALKEIEHLALYDPLTHLPNRRLLLDRLNQAVTASVRNGRLGALLFLDLDQFKTLNDSFGHHIGDELLRQVAIRLKGCVREIDTVARLGGDEFVVILEDLSVEFTTTAIQAENMAYKMLSALKQPYLLSEVTHHSSCSIGVALFGAEQNSIEELLKQADIAMYQAKQAGRNTVRFFNLQMQEKITHHVAIERELREAIYQQQFILHYQIQVDSAGNKLGVEALIRWQHPERGLLAPGQFIALAETSDLIFSIGQWSLNTACLQLKHWANNPLTQAMSIALNISAKQFHQAEFITQVKETLQLHAINPARLKFELTESILLDHVENTIKNMMQLKKMGIGIALDDFGTGYSSLQYLKTLPIDELKIDQSFVRDITTDPSDQAIVSTIIAMATTLNIAVIAEGVETEAQKQSLLEKNCQRFQGYLFGKPMPANELETLLAKEN